MTRKEATKIWKKNHPDRVRQQNREGSARFYKKNPFRQKDNALKRKYGITYEEYLAMVVSKEGKCEICSLEKKLYVDHDHKTGKIRGLLCMNCNAGLGNLRDEIELIERAAEYLKSRN